MTEQEENKIVARVMLEIAHILAESEAEGDYYVDDGNEIWQDDLMDTLHQIARDIEARARAIEHG